MKIQYPIITISGKSHIEFITNDRDLKICNKRALKNGYYNNLTIIDSGSKKIKIQSAKKEGTAGFLWGLNLFKGQQLVVSLNYSEKIERVKLNEFQKLLIKLINKDKYFWDSDNNLKKRIDFIINANSIENILERFTFEYFERY